MAEKFDIILIDDDVELRSLYAEVFRNDGFEVREANDGLQGLEMINDKTPDVIFTGIMMPRMDGFTLVETLKKNVATASVPVVLFSHLGREEDEKRAETLGVKKFIVKGMVSVKDVVRIVKSLLVKTVVEYHVFLDPLSLDAQKLVLDFGLNTDFSCVENGGKKWALTLTVKDTHARTFEAKFTCV